MSMTAPFAPLHDPDPAIARQAAAAIRTTAKAGSKRVIAVSACLLGEPVRYDGGHKHAPEALAPLLHDPAIILMPICPEVLAGMGCPRPTVQFAAGDGTTLAHGQGGTIVDANGEDRTAQMVHGAMLAEELCREAGVSAALLKERSPSCGLEQIHGPQGLQAGSGTFAARLVQLGLPIDTEIQPLPRTGCS
jgi:uncharacterized protein YbbK (DUF523 family)